MAYLEERLKIIKYEKENMSEQINTYDRKSPWYLAYQYWSSCPTKYKYVGLAFHKNQNQWSETVYRSVSGESAKKNLRYLQNNYYNQYVTHMLSAEQYNKLHSMIKNNTLPQDFKIEDLMSTSLAVMDQRQNVKGKVVHLVWNQTLGQVAWADLTQEVCITKAEELARANPTHEFVICSPVKRVYQPIKITTEDYVATE